MNPYQAQEALQSLLVKGLTVSNWLLRVKPYYPTCLMFAKIVKTEPLANVNDSNIQLIFILK